MATINCECGRPLEEPWDDVCKECYMQLEANLDTVAPLNFERDLGPRRDEIEPEVEPEEPQEFEFFCDEYQYLLDVLEDE